MRRPGGPLIVAYDGSDEARSALLWALREAAPDGAVLPVAVLGREPSPLPVLSRLPWAELVEEASDQALAAIQLLLAAYTILTL